MNIIRPPEFFGYNDPGPAPFAWVPLLASFLRRAWQLIGLCVLAAVLTGAAYVLTATPKYMATTQVLIDTRQGSAFQLQASGATDALADNAIVESQVEVLRSDGTARHVVAALHLTDNTTFLSWGRSLPRALLGRAMSLVEPRTPRPTATDDNATGAVELLQSMSAVRRIGLSNVIEVSVQSPDPVRSAQLANAITAAYIDDTLQAKYDVTRRAGAWLQDRLDELRDQSRSADRALAEQKARIGIVDTDKGGFNEQALGDLVTQLGIARARTAETTARLARIQAITQAGLTAPGSVADALVNTVILKLQQQYLDTERRLAEWTVRYGPNHAAVADLRRERTGLQVSLGDELRRIQETYRSDVAVAEGQAAALQTQVDALVAVSTATNSARAQLRALESLADTYRALYGSFLQRYTQAAQDQSFPISQARVVSPAIPPLHRSAPRTLQVMAGAGVVGLGIGIVAGLMREAMDRRFHFAAQVEAATGIACIAVLPGTPTRRMRTLERSPGPNRIPRQPALWRMVADQPLSAFSDGIRGIRSRLSSVVFPPGGVVVGIVSAVSGEGRSTIAANLGILLASNGHRAILVDCDFRNPGLSRAMAPGSRLGFGDASLTQELLDDAIWRDDQTGLAFLPAHRDGSGHPADTIGSPAATALIATLRSRFAFIVLDLPPLSRSADIAAAAGLADAFAIVVDGSATPQHAVQQALDTAPFDATKVMGIVLNRAIAAGLDTGFSTRAVRDVARA